jgi:Flp pilus assembly protein TadG
VIRRIRARSKGERGSVLVHVAVTLLGLVAFSALTIDYGIFWMSRRQAQNSADAAALAGAISLAFDSPTDFTRARASAETTGRTNRIFGLQPNITRGAGFSTDVTQDISFPPTATASCPSGSGPTDTCVRVNVYRTSNTLAGGAKDPLPTFFARLIGRTEQGVRATATAMVRTGNATDCLRPWAVADKWQENVRRVCPGNQTPPCQNGSWVDNRGNDWTVNDFFDKWNRTGNPPSLDTSITSSGNQYDYYQAPTETDPGTGFGLYNPDGTIKDYGQPVKLKIGSNNDPVSSGWFLSLDLSSVCTAPGCPTNSGGQLYQWAIQNCVGGTVGIGDTLPVETGNMVGPTDQGVYQSTGNSPLALYQRDPNATWNPITKTIENSCVPQGNCPGGFAYPYSPRIVPVALFNADAYLSAGFSGSNGSVTITNFFGFFIITQAQAGQLGLDTQGNQNGTVYGVMVAVPGLTRANTITTTSSFLREIVLVR